MITKDRFSITAPYLGDNMYDNTAIFANPRDEDNPHQVILGGSGAGKTFFEMVQALRQLYTGENQIFLDPDGQFSKYVQSLGFKVLRLNTSNGFNLFYIPNYDKIKDEDDKRRIENNHALAVVSALEVIIKGANENCKTGVLKELVNQYFKTTKHEKRHIDDFVNNFIIGNELFSHVNIEDLNNIKNGLLSYTSKGINGGYLSGNGGYDFNSQMLCFDCSEITYLSDSTKIPIIFLVFQMFINLITTDNKVKRRIVLDECHLYFKNPTIGQFLVQFVLMARKHNAGGTFITQETLEMTKENGGFTLINQASTKVIMNCSEVLVNDFIDRGIFNIDPETKNMILNFEKGECLYLTKKDKFYLRLIPFKEELEIIQKALSTN